MFWTAFIWGLGITTGASFGIIIFLIAYAGINWFTNTQPVKDAASIAELTLTALKERNELTKDQLKLLERVALSCETYLPNTELLEHITANTNR